MMRDDLFSLLTPLFRPQPQPANSQVLFDQFDWEKFRSVLIDFKGRNVWSDGTLSINLGLEADGGVIQAFRKGTNGSLAIQSFYLINNRYEDTRLAKVQTLTNRINALNAKVARLQAELNPLS